MNWRFVDAFVAGMQERGLDWRVVVVALAVACILACVIYGVQRTRQKQRTSWDKRRSRSGAEFEVSPPEEHWKVWKEEARKEAYAVRTTVFVFQSHYSVTTPLKALRLDGQQRECTFDTISALPKIEGGYWVPGDVPGRYRCCDVGAELAASRLKQRQHDTGSSGDIHENDTSYLTQCAQAGSHAARFFGWSKIACCSGNRERTEAEIHPEIFDLITRKT